MSKRTGADECAALDRALPIAQIHRLGIVSVRMPGGPVYALREWWLRHWIERLPEGVRVFNLPSVKLGEELRRSAIPMPGRHTTAEGLKVRARRTGERFTPVSIRESGTMEQHAARRRRRALEGFVSVDRASEAERKRTARVLVPGLADALERMADRVDGWPIEAGARVRPIRAAWVDDAGALFDRWCEAWEALECVWVVWREGEAAEREWIVKVMTHWGGRGIVDAILDRADARRQLGDRAGAEADRALAGELLAADPLRSVLAELCEVTFTLQSDDGVIAAEMPRRMRTLAGELRRRLAEWCGEEVAIPADTSAAGRGSVGERVREELRGMILRRERFTTLREMAKWIGCSHTYLARIVERDPVLRDWAKMPMGGARAARGLDGAVLDSLASSDDELARLIEEQETDARAERIHKRA